MNEIDKLFFELIRVAIGNQDGLSRLPSQKEWKALYGMAEKQSLVGVCFAALQRLGADADEGFARIGIGEMQYLKWMGMTAKIQRRNEDVDRQCVELQTRLAADGFRSYIMKGQAVASLYKVRGESLELRDLSGLRQSGDIDVYLEGGLEKVLAYAKTVGKTTGVNELEMHVKVFDDTEVEFHYRPFIMRNPFKNRKLQAFFKSQEEACFANRIRLGVSGERLEICAPTMEFNLIHQLAHIRLHLFTEGVGMRQLMDFYFVLLNTNRHELPTNFSLIIKRLGLERFASALMWVQGHVFEGDGYKLSALSSQLFGIEPNETDGQLLLEEVMTGGNFGRHNEKQNERKGKMGYSLWALFFRNLRLSRFDRGDWFWGPLWRVYHFVGRKLRG